MTTEPTTPETESPAPELPSLEIGAGAPAEQTESTYVPVIRGKLDRFGNAIGTGRRKTAVARVRIKTGDGKTSINGRPLEDYFRVERDRHLIAQPLQATEMLGKVDIWARLEGGGPTGQTGAMVLGIARALTALNPALHSKLSEGGFLTRDGRLVERKKYGRKKARRSFQFSKR